MKLKEKVEKCSIEEMDDVVFRLTAIQRTAVDKELKRDVYEWLGRALYKKGDYLMAKRRFELGCEIREDSDLRDMYELCEARHLERAKTRQLSGSLKKRKFFYNLS